MIYTRRPTLYNVYPNVHVYPHYILSKAMVYNDTVELAQYA